MARLSSRVNEAVSESEGEMPVIVLHTRPETQWATHEQVEGYVTVAGGPNR
jgi:hypothetical protein